MSIVTILLIVLILAMIGAFNNSANWGSWPGNGLGLVVVIIIILLLLGRLH